MSQATPSVVLAAHSAAATDEGVPANDESGNNSVRARIRRISQGMEAVDALIRSAMDARRALNHVLSNSFHAKNLREAVEKLVLPLITSMANFCVCHAALTDHGRDTGSVAEKFSELPAVEFEELGRTVELTPRLALEGLMTSLTATQPPMRCYYPDEDGDHIVHESWDDPGAFSDDSLRGPLMKQDDVESMPALWEEAVSDAEGAVEDAQFYMRNKVRHNVESANPDDTGHDWRWAIRLKEHIIDEVVAHTDQSPADISLGKRLLWLHNNCVRLLHCLRQHASPALSGAKHQPQQTTADLDSDTPVSSSSDLTGQAAERFADELNSALEFLPESQAANGVKSGNQHDGGRSTSLPNVDAHHYYALDELAYQLSTASFVDIKEFKQEFDDLDVDGRGELNLTQFEELMRRINIDIATKFVPYIFSKFDKNGNGLISYSEIIADYSVPKKPFIKFVNDKYEDVLHVRTLPLAIVYFFLFIYVSDFRELSGDLFYVTSAVTQRCLEQTEVYYEPEGRLIDFTTIQNPDEFWYWLEYGFFPVFGTDGAGSPSERYTVDDDAYNIIVNNQISLRQDRKTNITCDPTYSVAINAVCFDRSSYGEQQFGRELCPPGFNWTASPTQCFDSKPRPQLDSAFVSNPRNLEHDFKVSPDIESLLTANFGTNFSMASGQEQLRNKTSYLQGRHWIDSMTANVYIGVPIYNVATGAWANMLYILEVTDTGLWATRTYYEVAVTGPYSADKWHYWIPDVAWMCVLVALVVVEVKSIVRHATNPGKLGLCRKPRDAEGNALGRAYFHHGWNYFDWILIFMVYLQTIYWFSTLATQGPVIVEYVQSGAVSTDDVVNIVGGLGRSMWDYRIITVVTIILWIMRFFKSFMAQPRLAMITLAFRRSAEDLVHFAIVFVLLLVGFMYMGTNLFGHELTSFSDSFHAYWTLFYALVGEFEYEEGIEVAPLWGTIFWFLYIFLMTLVVMNMLLAIVIEAYLAALKESVEKHGQGKSSRLVTMWDQIAASLVNMYHTCRGSINLDQLVELLELLDSEEETLEVPFDNDASKSTVIEMTSVDNASVSAADMRRTEAMKRDPSSRSQSRSRPTSTPSSPRSFRAPRRTESGLLGVRNSDMLSLSDVTLALPRLMTFPPGEAGVTAKKISMNFIFDIFREFVLTRQEPRNEQIAQMCRRINELDSDFQGMMDSMDSLESMLHSIQTHQFKLLEHFNVYGQQEKEQFQTEQEQLEMLKIRKAMSSDGTNLPFSTRSPSRALSKILGKSANNSPMNHRVAAGVVSTWRNIARHVPLVPNRRHDSRDERKAADANAASSSMSTLGAVSMAMTKLHQNKLRRATAVSKPQDEKSKKHFQRKLTSAKQLQSWNDVLDTNTSGLMADGDSVPIKRHSAGGGSTRPAAKNNVGRTGSYDVSKRLSEGFSRRSSSSSSNKRNSSENLGIQFEDLEKSP